MKVLAIMGPTGSGKSDLAVSLAKNLSGEIINGDSMQIYRHLPIGTAAPTPDQIATVPHHLFAFVEPDQAMDAGAWSRLATEAIDEIAERGGLPMVVGGTHFWIRALFTGLSEIPEIPSGIKADVLHDLETHGAPALHGELALVDPLLAGRLYPTDSQRICRALEVYRGTGIPLSTFHERPLKPAYEGQVLKICVNVPRDVLYARIDARLDEMFANGLVDEVRKVLGMGFLPRCRAFKSSSYAPVVEFLMGAIDCDEMYRGVKVSHRGNAKRQMTWLRKEPGVVWVDPTDQSAIAKLVDEFLA